MYLFRTGAGQTSRLTSLFRTGDPRLGGVPVTSSSSGSGSSTSWLIELTEDGNMTDELAINELTESKGTQIGLLEGETELFGAETELNGT